MLRRKAARVGKFWYLSDNLILPIKRNWEGIAMRAILENCCGLDIHKEQITVCLLTGNLEENPSKEIRVFSTLSSGLHDLKEWLESKSLSNNNHPLMNKNHFAPDN